MEIKDLILDFTETRPKSEVVIGYGSAIKKQANDLGLSKQYDLILGVDDASKWHKENYSLNPTDYSQFGFKLLPVYSDLKTKVNYLTYLQHKNSIFKVGVISMDALINDLINWDSFYLAGRFQKPIEVVKSNPSLDKAIEINRLNALKVALLLSKKSTINEKELYKTICSLSFIGDWRNILHVENPKKIDNIIDGNYREFQEIYHSLIKTMCSSDYLIDYDKLMFNLDTLPDKLLHSVLKKMKNYNLLEADKELIRTEILRYFYSINIITTAVQPIKGFILNGPSKTKNYLKHKIEKNKA